MDREVRVPALLFSAYTASSCLGHGLAATLATLREARSGLSQAPFETVDLPCWTGTAAGLDTLQLPPALSNFDCRNNRLAWQALQQDGFMAAAHSAISRYGAARVGIFLGTSTSGILSTEQAYRQRDAASGALPPDLNYHDTHNTYSVAKFVRAALGAAGPAFVVSTACSSSAKVFGNAQRMIAAGLIDAAVVGGVDSLCLTTLYGFHSLQLLSADIARPFDAERNGLSIGEAAAFVLLERAPQEAVAGVYLLGVGESSDAHHMSSPHPEGLGAQIAMRQALDAAGLQTGDIDYINLHGTATPSNDAAEALAVNALFGQDTACSSTKGATGHTLGAAGGLEAVICALAIEHGLAPGDLNVRTLDSALKVNYLLSNQSMPIRYTLSNSFGFGGTNCSLVIGLRGAA